MENSEQQQPSWFTCQLGAREHYSIPRALHRLGLLEGLVTDIWMRTAIAKRQCPIRRWRDRCSADIPPELVSAFTTRSVLFEIGRRLVRMHGWRLMIARNRWFQERALSALERLSRSGNSNEQRVCFSYSYTARRPFQLAKQRGWRTVLGQIDPGPVEERILADLYRNTNDATSTWEPAPMSYWDQWREECALADHIVVNSAWSQRALTEEGISSKKIHVIPLAYESAHVPEEFVRRYPLRFSSARPMRVLFLGQANLRKGILVLMEAMRRMRQAEIEFWIVGDVSVSVPTSMRSQKNIRWIGSVPRSEAQRYYRQADVFVLPTYSDGFALTQLEAQAWKLPLITSPFCGDVVRHGQNGIRLNAVGADELELAITQLLRAPATLAAMSEESHIEDRFSLSSLGQSLCALGHCQ